MAIEVKVPSPGESITEVEIGNWLVKDQDYVEKDQDIAEVESDKATLTIVADESGVITIKETEGEMIEVGAVIATIDTDAEAPEKEEKPQKEEKEDSEEVASEEDNKEGETKKEPEVKDEEKKQDEKQSSDYDKVKVTSVAKEMMKDQNLSIDDVINGLKRIGKKEIEAVSNLPKQEMKQQREASRETEENRMSSLRRKVSARLVSVKNETAMLTTFNEIDMGAIMKLRKKYQNQFVEKYGYKVGFMSFFTKAVSIAAEAFPMVNSQIDGENIVTPKFVDVGIAVSTPKGLMVPVVRNVETKSIPQLEKEIGDLASKARNKKISVEELTGGTFTITNGGIFGSLFSTPIINPPQSAILGMHNIVERPMAVNGEVVIRPMMYVALSYDHRIIDGKDSVQFLMKIKEVIENPELLYSDGKDVNEMLLDI